MSRVYSKDSFDRFGDDFCELILSYLRLFDKINFECISKQFCRSVYEKQFRLIVNKTVFQRLLRTDRKGKTFTDVNRFERLVKKLCNVRVIDVEYSQLWCDFAKFLQIQELTEKHCEHLKEINIHFINVTDDQVNQVLKKFGSKITKIEFAFNDNMGLYSNFSMINMHYCTNLKELNVILLRHIFIGKNKCISKNLKSINFVYLDQDHELLSQIIELHHDSLDSIDVCLIDNSLVAIDRFFTQIRKVKKLKKLHVTFIDDMDTSIADNLRRLSESCALITDLSIYLNAFIIDHNLEIYTSIKHFQNLNKLNLSLYSKLEQHTFFHCRSEELKKCKHLTHLTIDTDIDGTMNDHFLDDMDRYLPNLRYICLTMSDISDQAFDSLMKLKHLVKLDLTARTPKQMMDCHIYDLISNCHSLKEINLKNIEFMDKQEIRDSLRHKYGIHDNNLIQYINKNKIFN